MRDGLLLVDKEPGCTSHDVVQRVRRLLGQKKIGHCGTLDPDATGLLLLTLGRATRLTRFLIKAPKVYEGVVAFGVATDTYDASGETTSEASFEGLDPERIDRTMASFEGVQEQQPPPYSAKKVGGVKYYELARRGEEIPDAKKTVEIFEFVRTSPLDDGGRLTFRLGCSSGTYARTLAHDLGREMGCGGHLAGLRRSCIGPLRVEDAVTLEALAEALEAGEELSFGWIPFDAIPLPFGRILADAQQEHRITHGQNVLVRELDADEGDWIQVVNQREQLIAVGSVVERIGSAGVGIVRPRIVFR